MEHVQVILFCLHLTFNSNGYNFHDQINLPHRSEEIRSGKIFYCAKGYKNIQIQKKLFKYLYYLIHNNTSSQPTINKLLNSIYNKHRQVCAVWYSYILYSKIKWIKRETGLCLLGIMRLTYKI